MGKNKREAYSAEEEITIMEPREKEWLDALSEQDIPATVVDWDSIIAPEEESELSDSEKLDAEKTIEDASPF